MSLATVVPTGSLLPPVFNQNPFSYAFALFGLILLVSLALAHLVQLARCIDPHRNGYTSPITLHQVRSMMLALCFVTLEAPDVVILLAWNEITDGTMTTLWVLDRFLDGFTVLPFFVAATITIRGGERIDLALVSANYAADIWPTWRQTRDHLWIIGVTALIAAGVALGKV